MNTLELIDALVERIGIINKGFVYKLPFGNGESELNLFSFDLPAKRSKPANTDSYPFVIVRPGSGSTPKSDESIVNISVIVGIFDSEDDHQGERDCILIMERLQRDFYANPILKKGAIFNNTFEWEFIEDQPAPYFTLGISTAWVVTTPQYTQGVEYT